MVKKQSSKKPKVQKKSPKKLGLWQRFIKRIKGVYAGIKLRVDGFLARRPHRSFRMTKRRDYVRSLKLPGYWSFTNYVRSVLWQHRKLFVLLALLYGLLTMAFVGMASQDNYQVIQKALTEASDSSFEGGLNQVAESGILLLSGIMGTFSSPLTEAQQILAILFGLLTWMTTIWLLRSLLSGQTPKLRDGLYNSTAPLVSSFLVFGVLMIQLIPIAFATLIFFTGMSTEFFGGGAASMMVSAGIFLLTTLSIYWVSSTLIALVIVTLPGMYPFQALRTAGDLVVGRRIRILLRILWLQAITLAVWAVVMIPIIIFDAWLKSVWTEISWLPIVPVCLLIISSLSVVWTASYIYLLYRKVVDDDASPA